MLKLFLSFFIRMTYWWVHVYIVTFNHPVKGIFFFDYAFWHTNAFPFGSSIVHSVHKFTVPSYIFGVSIWAVPVAEACLFSYFSFTTDKFAVSKYICSATVDASFLRFVGLITSVDTWRSKSYISMQVHIQLTINFALKVLRKLVELLLFLNKHRFEFWVFFSFNILDISKLLAVAWFDVFIIKLFGVLNCLYKFSSNSINSRSMFFITIYNFLSFLLLFLR